MKLWLASSNLNLIEELVGSGLFAGTITNPDLIAAGGITPEHFGREVLQRTSGDLFLQVPDGTALQVREQAQRLASLDPARIIVKVAATREGLAAMASLVSRGVRVAATCLPTLPLAVAAEAVGAHFIIPWGSLLAKRGIGDRDTLIAEIHSMLRRQDSRTELLAGAYGPAGLVRLAQLGVRHAFVWEKDVEALIDQPLAREAAGSFQAAWDAIDRFSY